MVPDIRLSYGVVNGVYVYQTHGCAEWGVCNKLLQGASPPAHSGEYVGAPSGHVSPHADTCQYTNGAGYAMSATWSLSGCGHVCVAGSGVAPLLVRFPCPPPHTWLATRTANTAPCPPQPAPHYELVAHTTAKSARRRFVQLCEPMSACHGLCRGRPIQANATGWF